MIYLIIKSYLSLLITIGSVSLTLLMLGLYFIFRKRTLPIGADIECSLDESQSDSSGKTGAIQTPSPESTDIPGMNRDAILTGYDLDVTAIAGDDPIATQLDLARAYIEAGRKQLAKTILDTVNEQGSALQQQEVQHLLSIL